MFNEKTILVTGGTGTIGQFLVQKLTGTGCKRIVVFSRDENKQFFMQQQYSDKRIEYVLGDVRDYQRLENALFGVDYVIHAAALKQVPMAEINPMEAVEINIVGTHNVLYGSARQQVKKVVCLSTDKSVAPSNCMGMTKGVCERLITSSARLYSNLDAVCVRLGNVLGSRGSVIQLWKKQIEQNRTITLTDERMTRFVMTYEDVFRLLMHAFAAGAKGEIIIPNVKACRILDLAKVVCLYYGLDVKKNMLITGARPGEKLYEELFTIEEMQFIYQNDTYYHIGNQKGCWIADTTPYRSDKCTPLDCNELEELLRGNNILKI